MNAIRNSISMWRFAGAGIGFRNQLLAFLCSRLGNLSENRHYLRTSIIKWIGFFARNGQIKCALSIAGRPIFILLRKGNKADYLVFGEMVMGGFKVPGNFSHRPAAVVDGGANIGLFTLFAYANFPDIKATCYEPDQDNLIQLRRNLEVNNIAAEVVPKALWSKTADLFFHPGESYSGFVSTELSPYPISCVMPTVPNQSWLKLDVEGAEYEVLPAVLNANCQPDMVSMEIHNYHQRGQELLSLLKACGYIWDESFQPSEACVNISAYKQNS